MDKESLGDEFAGRYHLIAPIGRGSMGVVYKAIDLRLQRQVAIKIISSARAAGTVPRVVKEAQTLARLHHPNVVAVYDVGEKNGDPYLVTAFVDGRSLAEILRTGGPLEPRRALEMIAQIGDALAFMHRHGLTHRDIKPANILVAASGQALLSDFGLAIAFDDATLTADGKVQGTPRYMSPEQAMGLPLDGRSDIYSLAVVLYEALSGQSWLSDPSAPAVDILTQIVERPLPPVQRLTPEFSDAVNAILERALAKNPDARYSSADEFVRALRAAQPAAPDIPIAGASSPRLNQAPDDIPDTSEVDADPATGTVARRPPGSSVPLGVFVGCAVFVLLLLGGMRAIAPRENWRGSALLFVGGIGGFLLIAAWRRFRARPREQVSSFATDGEPPQPPAEARSSQAVSSHLTAIEMHARSGPIDDLEDDLPATAAVAPYAPVTVRRLNEFAAVWKELSRSTKTDRDRFVDAARTIAGEFLREAVGYRIEQSIPYLKGTVGFMVEAPFLWIRHSRFPILFVAYDGPNDDLLTTVVQQIEIAKATEFFALLVVVPPRDKVTGHEAQELKHLVADSVYRHDFVVLDRQHLTRLIAQNSSRSLVEIILEQGIELSALSPYVVSGPVPENMFFGRESQLKTISQRISGSNFAVIGGRRIGKSSILLRLKRLFSDDPRYRAIYIDCEARFDEENFLAALAEYANLPVDGAPPSFQRIVSALRVKSPKQILVFLLDEIDELLEFDAGRRPPGPLFKTLRAASNEGVCRFVFSGSRTLYRHLRDPHSPFFNFCEAITLRCLQDKSVIEIVSKPMQQLGCDIPAGEQLLARLIELTSSHPNLAQWMCDRLIKTSVGRRITVQALEQLAATPEFQEHYVSTAWGDATPIERLISLVMEGPVFTDIEVEEKLVECGLPRDQRAVRESLDVLCLYSLLDRDESGYRFALSQFPRIVRESGVARAQVEWLASEVRSRCS